MVIQVFLTLLRWLFMIFGFSLPYFDKKKAIIFSKNTILNRQFSQKTFNFVGYLNQANNDFKINH